MNNPLISRADAQHLNGRLQRDVDPRLFLFCNYEPTFPRPVSDDGTYYVGIQDLYKFAVDSGCILKEYFHYIPRAEKSAFDDMGRILDDIVMLRAMTDHNQSPENGRMDKQTVDAYDRWITKIIGKNTPDSIQDYQKLVEKLADMAASLIGWAEKFIDFVAHSPQKDELAEKMISRILRWYASNTTTRIYEGQLQDAYLARANAAGRYYVALKPQWIIRSKIGRWIEKAECFPFEEEIQQLDHELQEIQTSIDRINSPTSPWAGLLSAEDTKKLIASLDTQKAEKVEERCKAQQELNEHLRSVGGKPYQYLSDHLTERLRETMMQLDGEGTTYDLLPQNLLQMDVERRFRGIPSPESDF